MLDLLQSEATNRLQCWPRSEPSAGVRLPEGFHGTTRVTGHAAIASKFERKFWPWPKPLQARRFLQGDPLSFSGRMLLHPKGAGAHYMQDRLPPRSYET